MRRGAQEIMDHPWFASLNFTELYNKTVSTRVQTKAPRTAKSFSGPCLDSDFIRSSP